MQRLLFLYNPNAGKGFAGRNLSSGVEVFTRGGYMTTVWPTQGKGDATRVVAQQGGDYHRIICCGGDGTLNEVVTGLMQGGHKTPVGYIPAGTTNDFSRNLGLPQGFEAMAEVAVCGQVYPCDMGRFNEKNFVYVAAFGAFTNVSYATTQEAKKAFGHLAYVIDGAMKLGDLATYHTMTVEYDEGVIEGDFLFGMVSNTTSVGGIQLFPRGSVCLDDGLFEVLLVRRPEKLGDWQSTVLGLLRQAPQGGHQVEAFHTKGLRITAKAPVPWSLDGEFGGDHQTVEVKALHQVVNLAFGALI